LCSAIRKSGNLNGILNININENINANSHSNSYSSGYLNGCLGLVRLLIWHAIRCVVIGAIACEVL
jgi:hypothetical protein